jgi:hypothetical protein
MEITFKKTYRKLDMDGSGEFDCNNKGSNWTAYHCVDLKDSAIIHQLLNIVCTNRDVEFDTLYEKLKEHYKNKTVKSRCDIIKDEQRIEVIVKGVFPRFYIQKQ